MFTGNRHNEFRAHIGSLILLIFQNMVNRSTCPMAALQIPCFLLTVHMAFRHMIRCRGRDLLFIQDFCDGACFVALQCQFKDQPYILAGYRVEDQLMAIVRVRQESKRAVSSEIHSFLLHHMVGCCDFSGKVPAVGCVDDVLNGYFQSTYIVSDLHSTVVTIVDGDEANTQHREDALHVISCLNVITGKPGKVLYDDCFYLTILCVLNQPLERRAACRCAGVAIVHVLLTRLCCQFGAGHDVPLYQSALALNAVALSLISTHILVRKRKSVIGSDHLLLTAFQTYRSILPLRFLLHDFPDYSYGIPIPSGSFLSVFLKFPHADSSARSRPYTALQPALPHLPKQYPSFHSAAGSDNRLVFAVSGTPCAAFPSGQSDGSVAVSRQAGNNHPPKHIPFLSGHHRFSLSSSVLLFR